MKNLKYLYKFILVLPFVFMVGCIGTDDFNDLESNQYTQQSTVFIETDDASEITRTVPGNVAQPIEVGINNAQSGDITVSFNVTKDGAAAVEGVDYTLADATILAGDFFGSSEVTFMSSGIYVVTVSGASAGSLIPVDNKAIFNVPPAVTVSISWADSNSPEVRIIYSFLSSKKLPPGRLTLCFLKALIISARLTCMESMV